MRAARGSRLSQRHAVRQTAHPKADESPPEETSGRGVTRSPTTNVRYP